MDYLACPNWLVRLLQRGHLRFTRLGGMLRRRGIDHADYVRYFPIVEVEEQFARCHACVCQPLCDRVLRRPHVPGRSNYTFCPNLSFIDGYRLSGRKR